MLEQIDRKDDSFVVSEHFTRPDHDKDDFRVQILEAGTSRTSWDRDGAKNRWIKKLMATDAGGDDWNSCAGTDLLIKSIIIDLCINKQ